MHTPQSPWSGTRQTPFAPLPHDPPLACAPRLRYGAASLCGSYHKENEDSHTPAHPDPLWLAVVDGVGGGALGKLASQTLLQQLGQLPPDALYSQDCLRDWLHAADLAVAQTLAKHTSQPGAATFVAAWPSQEHTGRWHLSWAGDCRAYRLSQDHGLQLLTTDDTYFNLGELPPPGGHGDDPARMVGSGAVDEANYASVQLFPGDILFLCSDGLHKQVSDKELQDILHQPISLDARCFQLCQRAHQNGGRDDATLIAAEWLPCNAPAAAPRWQYLLLAAGILIAIVLLMLYRHGKPAAPPQPETPPPVLSKSKPATASSAAPAIVPMERTLPPPPAVRAVDKAAR